MPISDLATLGGIALATIVLAWTLVVYLRVGAPSLSSSQDAARAMVDMLAPRAGWTVYELGCGTGKVAAARIFTARVPVSKIDAGSGARALDQALTVVLADVVRWVNSGR